MSATFRTVVSTTGTDASAEGALTGISDGDIMIAFLNHSASSATMTTGASGWDLVEVDPNPADFSCLCYKRVKQAGDAAPTWTWSAAGNWTVDIIAYSGQDTTTPLDDTSGTQGAGINEITTASVTPSVANCMLVWFASTDASGGARTWTQGGTPTERLDQVNNAHHRCIAEELITSSGSGVTRTATVTGSAQDIGAFAVLVRPASGTAYNQSVSGGMTPVGAIFKDGRKVLTGAITPSGTNTKLTSKTFSGTLSSITGTLTKQAGKVLSGALSSISGAVSSIRFAIAIVSGAMTPAGDLTKLTSKTFAGATTPAGTLTNQTTKTFAGFISTMTGEILKQSNKTLTGDVTPSGALTKFRVSLLDLSGAISTITGALFKQTNKPFFGDMASSGALIKSTLKNLLGAISAITGDLIKQSNKMLAGAITPDGVLTRIKLSLLNLSGAIDTITGALTKQTNKIVSGDVASSGAIVRDTSKSLSGNITPSGSVLKAITRLLAGVLNFAGSLIAVLGGVIVQTAREPIVYVSRGVIFIARSAVEVSRGAVSVARSAIEVVRSIIKSRID